MHPLPQSEPDPCLPSLSWHQALWCIWAAKEAAFKAAAKIIPDLPFSPSAILVQMLPTGAAAARTWYEQPGGDSIPVKDSACRQLRPLASGWAMVRGQWFAIQWEADAEAVHAVAVGPYLRPDASAEAGVQGAATEAGLPGAGAAPAATTPAAATPAVVAADWAPTALPGSAPAGPIRVLHAVAGHDEVLLPDHEGATAARASAAVRRLAGQLLQHVPGLQQLQLEIRRHPLPSGILSAPRVYPQHNAENQPLQSVDISLSHDGPWAAAAVLY